MAKRRNKTSQKWRWMRRIGALSAIAFLGGLLWYDVPPDDYSDLQPQIVPTAESSEWLMEISDEVPWYATDIQDVKVDRDLLLALYYGDCEWEEPVAIELLELGTRIRHRVEKRLTQGPFGNDDFDDRNYPSSWSHAWELQDWHSVRDFALWGVGDALGRAALVAGREGAWEEAVTLLETAFCFGNALANTQGGIWRHLTMGSSMVRSATDYSFHLLRRVDVPPEYIHRLRLAARAVEIPDDQIREALRREFVLLTRTAAGVRDGTWRLNLRNPLASGWLRLTTKPNLTSNACAQFVRDTLDKVGDPDIIWERMPAPDSGSAWRALRPNFGGTRIIENSKVAVANMMGLPAKLRCTIALVDTFAAIRIYQQTHGGELPTDLAMLDDDLPLLADPYSGEPPKLGTDSRRRPIVYSVGDDQTDDGGAGREPSRLLILPDRPEKPKKNPWQRRRERAAKEAAKR